MTNRKIRKLVPRTPTPFKIRKPLNGNIVWALYTQSEAFKNTIRVLLKTAHSSVKIGFVDYGKGSSIRVFFIPSSMLEGLTAEGNTLPDFVLLHRKEISLRGQRQKKWMTKRMKNKKHEAFRQKMIRVWNPV